MIGIGDEGGAHCAHIFPAGHFLKLPHTESLIDFSRRVAQEQKRQRMLFGKLAVAFDRILAYADERITLIEQSRIGVTQRTSLGCASRGIILRIKINHKRLSRKIGSLHFRPI